MEINSFFSTKGFMPHGQCILWQPNLLGLHVISDLIITLSYYSMPIAFFFYMKKKKETRFQGMYFLFITFFILCGSSHLYGIITIWIPEYWVEGLFKMGTAGTSIVSAVFIWRLMPKALALSTPEVLLNINQTLQNEIEKRKAIEEELTKSTTMLRAVLDNIPSSVFWKDLNSVYLGCNLLAAKDAGLNNPDEILGKNDFELAWKAHANLYRTDDQEVIQSGKPKLKYEEPVGIKSGERIWARTSKVPLRDMTGKVTGILGTYEDITENKKTEEKLEKTREKLIHAEKLSASGKLAASIAHEFNNPIYGIRNVLEMINEEVPMDRTHQKFVSLAVKECNRIKDLILRLQEFHRPTSGNKEFVDVHEIIDETIIWVKKRLEQKNIVLETHYCKNLPRVALVSDQLKQVLLNLIQNAEEALPETDGKIKILTEDSSSFIKIAICDNGIGIEPGKIKNIFDPFFTTKSEVKGTGLGLSVSYGIIKSHGGDIKVTSEKAKGTKFIITLPI
jgi:PAS domain S-box-containing protein